MKIKKHNVINVVQILALILLFLFFQSCKKDVSQVNCDVGEGRAWFTDTVRIDSVGTNRLFVAYSEFRGTIYVVQKKFGSAYQLTKCDNETNVIYSKTIDLGPHELMQIVGGKTEDCFYTVTASSNFGVNNGLSLNAFVGGTFIDTSCSNNLPMAYYHYLEDFNPKPWSYQVNHTELKKYSANGVELWKKTEEGNLFSETAIQVDMNDNVYLLCAESFPLSYKLNMNYSGTFPYYDEVLDSNSFSLSKFNSSGSLLVKKEVCCVYSESGSGFNPSLSLSSSALYVNNTNGLYSFNLNLDLQSQKKPLKNICYNILKSVVANPNIPFVCVSGYLRYLGNNVNFYLSTLVNTDEKSVLQNLNFSPDYFAIDKSKNLFSFSVSNRITKIKSDGTEVFSKILNPDFVWQTLNKKNCFLDKYDKLYCFSLENGLIKVYKLDENGNF